MPTRKELHDLRADTANQAEALVKKAEAEDRDLTLEESGKYDELLAKVDQLSKRLKRATDVEAFGQVDMRIVPPADPIDPHLDPAPRRESAKPKRYGALKHFSGPDADERAFRAGQFYLACIGRPSAKRWLEQQGIELRVQQENVNTTGGYLVPDQIDTDLIDLREKYGIFRQYARRAPMTSDTCVRPRRTAGLTAYFVGENATGTESTKTWDQVTLVAKKMMIVSTITNELNEDAIINVGDDLSGEIAWAFANKEDECGFNGDGTSTYGGIIGARMAFTNLGATIAYIAGLTVASGNAYSEITLADFNNTMSKLPAYADTPNCRWFVHKTFWHSVMEMRAAAAGGNTMGDIAAGIPARFLGYEVVKTQVMPKVEANSQVCAIFGDLALAADFGDRRSTTIAFSDSATVGSTNVFTADTIAVRGTERFDIVVHDVGNYNATATSRVSGPIVGMITAAS